MEEKEIYAIRNDIGFSKVMKLTKDQYRAINWFIDTFDCMNLESIVIEPVEDAAEEIGEKGMLIK